MNAVAIVLDLSVIAIAFVAILYLHTKMQSASAEFAAKDAALVEMTAQRDYWRTRAEQLIDAGLARTGTIHQPTMEQVPPRNNLGSMAALAAALSVTEIDSRKVG